MFLLANHDKWLIFQQLNLEHSDDLPFDLALGFVGLRLGILEVRFGEEGASGKKRCFVGCDGG